jgi:hypothetical protein
MSHDNVTLDHPVEVRKQSALEEGEESETEPKEREDCGSLKLA